MSDMKGQGTGDVLGDERDFFEEDFAPLVPGSFVELPEGFDIDPRFTAFLTRDITGHDVQRVADATGPVTWSLRLEEDELGKPITRDIQIEGVQGAFDCVGFVSRQQLDDDETKETISDLPKHGAVTIVDGKTGTSIDAVSYELAAITLDLGDRHPYDAPEDTAPAVDWAHAAVRGILDELRDLPGIKHYLDDIEAATRVEIVEALSDIVRAAFIRRAA